MREPGTPAERATADEIAMVYLRGRDVPCVGCGYNRRDGVGAACPECGAPVELENITETKRRGLERVPLFIALGIAFVSLSSVTRHGSWIELRLQFQTVSEMMSSRQAVPAVSCVVLSLASAVAALFFAIGLVRGRFVFSTRVLGWIACALLVLTVLADLWYTAAVHGWV